MRKHSATRLLALILSLRYVARCDRSQRQNSVAATMIFTCHARRFVEATCRGDVSQRFVAPCSRPLANAIHVVHDAFEFYVAVLQRAARKCTKLQNARAERLSCSLNLLFGEVFVALVVCENSQIRRGIRDGRERRES